MPLPLSKALRSDIEDIESAVVINQERPENFSYENKNLSRAITRTDPEFFDLFLAEDEAYGRFFAQGKEDRMLFDLPGFGLYRLRAAGIAEAEWTRHCTYSDPARFYSYRRSTHAKEADYGRLISAICL